MKTTETHVTLIHLIADENKVFKRKEDNEIFGSELWLGSEDSQDNYVEIDKPLEEV